MTKGRGYLAGGAEEDTAAPVVSRQPMEVYVETLPSGKYNVMMDVTLTCVVNNRPSCGSHLTTNCVSPSIDMMAL